ncbi:hypothetical protein [Haloferula sp. BvORR071]|uniref:hypothetical protein n=1 Tax=Haloferula sp. BvORR071 TaxID=1396141 RepID=UPI0005522700|nr:hypothetical protein [Haloferula sp. BvORR071]
MKPALHRSLIFWSGILVMTFIVWAWWESEFSRVAVITRDNELVSRTSGIALVHHPGMERTKPIGMTWAEMSCSADPSMRLAQPGILHWKRFGLPLDSSGGEPGDPALREYKIYAMWGWTSAGAGWLCFIPYWLVLLVVAIPWLALLAWRARRRRRIHPPA